MNQNDLKRLIDKGENETVEFKKSFQKDVIESVVAFANAKGGKVLIGISDAKKISGVLLSNETLKEWLNQIKNSTYPSILPEVEAHTVHGKSIVEITVSEHPIKPIAFKNRYFKRIKNSNHLMTLDEIANEHLKTINSSWDYHIDTRHDFTDISMDKIVGLITRIEKHRGKPFDDDPLTILKKYELVKTDKLTFAAYLLFVDNISAITSLQIGRFKSETTIIDSISLKSDLIGQIDQSIDFIKKNLMLAYIITGKPEREERYDYPMEAIREIVVNMVVHRDYRDSGNSIIKIFDDKIEFFNPGKLYDDLTIEKLQSGDYSYRTRNRAIANIFKESGIIERYGSGIKRVNSACVQHGIPAPLFQEFQHGFKVTLFKSLPDEGVSEGVTEGVTRLLILIRQNPGQRAPFFETATGSPRKTIERWLKQLKNQGEIEFRGAPRTGGYFVTNLKSVGR